MVTKEDLNALQKKKLKLAAGILQSSATLYDGAQSTLPLWGGGVITHGIPKIKKCVIGITEGAKKEKKENNLPKPGSYDSESLKNNNKNSHLWGR